MYLDDLYKMVYQISFCIGIFELDIDDIIVLIHNYEELCRYFWKVYFHIKTLSLTDIDV